MKKSAGNREVRTRVICSLPLNNARQEKAFKDIIALIQEQRESGVGVTGYSYSTPGTFEGFWWTTARNPSGEWELEDITLLVVDYQFSVESHERVFSRTVSELKQKIGSAYRTYGSPQQEIWVVSHGVSRYT